MPKRKEPDFCCVVDQFCDHPPMEQPEDSSEYLGCKTECYICGQPVCIKCSTRRKHRMHDSHKRRRICNNCQVELDGNDHHVVRRLWHLANDPVPLEESRPDLKKVKG